MSAHPSARLREVLGDGPCPALGEGRRLAWERGLSERLEAERERFDAIAAWRSEDVQREAPGPWVHSPVLVANEVTALLARIPSLLDVSDKTILDIGGTAPVSWRFVSSGARALHHVDVSPASQQVGYQRCVEQAVDLERVWFHTTPAEDLPFQDASFDLVFSRNSIHHLARPDAYDAIARVLKPGGRLLVFEPWLNRPMRALVMGRRRLLGIDRGTDDPLWRNDILQLQRRFRSVQTGRFGAGATAAIWTLGRFRRLHPLLRAARTLEGRIGHDRWVSRCLATHGWVVAER